MHHVRALLAALVDRFGDHPVWIQTIFASLAVSLFAVITDYLVNVVLAPGLTPYTPWSTLVIVWLVAPPCVFVLAWQTARIKETSARLADEHAARIALETAALARNRFLANLSHELRTPLNGIIGYSELMLEDAEEEGRRQAAGDHQRIIALSQRLLRLLNDLLDLAKADAQKLTLSAAPYDIPTLLHEAVSAVRPQAAANGNVIKVDVAPNLGAGVGDAFRIGQCVMNLLSNAAKFTHEGEISIRARRSLIAGAEWIIIDVQDTGVGISAEHQRMLFEPFMQAEGLGHTVGTGLGLAITRQLARLMNGDVTVESALGQGSRFTFKAPLRLEQRRAPSAGIHNENAAPASLSIAE